MANLDEQIDTAFTTVEPIVVTAEPEKKKPLSKRILSDIQVGLGEIIPQAYSGAAEAINETGNLAEDLARWGGKDLEIPDLDTYGDPKSITGAAARGITQFVVGFIGAGKITKPIKLFRKAGGFTKASVHGAMADATVFDPEEARLSDLIESNPSLRNPITTYLKSDPNDTRAEGRFKNAIEGLGLGVVAEGFIRSLRVLKSRKKIDTELDKLPTHVRTKWYTPATVGAKGVPRRQTTILHPFTKKPIDDEIGENIIRNIEEKGVNNAPYGFFYKNKIRNINWIAPRRDYIHGTYEVSIDKGLREDRASWILQGPRKAHKTGVFKGSRYNPKAKYQDMPSAFRGNRGKIDSKKFNFMLQEYLADSNAVLDTALIKGDPKGKVLEIIRKAFDRGTASQEETINGIRVVNKKDPKFTPWHAISKDNVDEFYTILKKQAKESGPKFLHTARSVRVSKLPIDPSVKSVKELAKIPTKQENILKDFQVGRPTEISMKSSRVRKGVNTIIKSMHKDVKKLEGPSRKSVEDFIKEEPHLTVADKKKLRAQLKIKKLKVSESQDLVTITDDIRIPTTRLESMPTFTTWLDTNKSQIVKSKKYQAINTTLTDVENVMYGKKEIIDPTLPIPKPPVVKLTKDIVFRALKHTQKTNPKANTIMNMLYGSGMRISDLVKTKIKDIDLETGVINLRNSEGDVRGRAFIPSRTRETIKNYLKTSSRHINKDTPWLFPSSKGKKHLTTEGVAQILAKTADDIGVDRSILAPHEFRRAYATDLQEAGVPTETIQKLLGHKTITSTATYIDPKVPKGLPGAGKEITPPKFSETITDTKVEAKKLIANLDTDVSPSAKYKKKWQSQQKALLVDLAIVHEIPLDSLKELKFDDITVKVDPISKLETVSVRIKDPAGGYITIDRLPKETQARLKRYKRDNEISKSIDARGRKVWMGTPTYAPRRKNTYIFTSGDATKFTTEAATVKALQSKLAKIGKSVIKPRHALQKELKDLAITGDWSRTMDIPLFIRRVKSMGIKEKMAFAERAGEFLKDTYRYSTDKYDKFYRVHTEAGYTKEGPKELFHALEELVFEAQVAQTIIDTLHGFGLGAKKGIKLPAVKDKDALLNKVTEAVMEKITNKSILMPHHNFKVFGTKDVDSYFLIPRSDKFSGLREGIRDAKLRTKPSRGKQYFSSPAYWKIIRDIGSFIY